MSAPALSSGKRPRYQRRTSPSYRVLAAILIRRQICWGICVICLGACNNYLQLSMVRMLLGWFECAVTPGFLLGESTKLSTPCLVGIDDSTGIASWYKRSESTLRSRFFSAMYTFFSIVFGIVMYAISPPEPFQLTYRSAYFLAKNAQNGGRTDGG